MPCRHDGGATDTRIPVRVRQDRTGVPLVATSNSDSSPESRGGSRKATTALLVREGPRYSCDRDPSNSLRADQRRHRIAIREQQSRQYRYWSAHSNPEWEPRATAALCFGRPDPRQGVAGRRGPLRATTTATSAESADRYARTRTAVGPQMSAGLSGDGRDAYTLPERKPTTEYGAGIPAHQLPIVCQVVVVSYPRTRRF